MTILSLDRARLLMSLDAAQDEWLDKPVIWGADDCALACASVLEPVLGYDPAAHWRGRYTTPRGYLRVLRKDGFYRLDDAIQSVARKHGWHAVEFSDASPGDLGIMAHQQGRTACLALGNGFWMARMERGFAIRPTSEIEKAWSVLNDAD